MKILHTADWHLGTFRSPVKDGVNLRTEDTKRCLDELIRVANEEKPDYSIVSGDIFHVGRLWSDMHKNLILSEYISIFFTSSLIFEVNLCCTLFLLCNPNKNL